MCFHVTFNEIAFSEPWYDKDFKLNKKIFDFSLKKNETKIGS